MAKAEATRRKQRSPEAASLATAQNATVAKVFLKEWVGVGVLIFGGCCSNVYTLEVLVTQEPRSGHLITLAQFLLVATLGLFQHLKSPKLGYIPRLVPRSIPISHWLAMVCLYWTLSVLNNYALGFKIPMPLHIIFRSGSLLVSMLLSWGIFGARFSRQQVTGVVLVTVGIIVSTYSSAISHSAGRPSLDMSLSEYIFGLAVLFIALVLACLLGQFQQYTYGKFGKHWREGLFYTHILGLPPFLFLWNELKTQIIAYNHSTPISVGEMLAPILGVLPKSLVHIVLGSWWVHVQIPQMWLFLLLNTATQYMCISAVHKLSSMVTSVSLNLVLSVRKFVSLVLSLILFDNHFTGGHWVGTAAVFAGTAVYTNAAARNTQIKSKGD
ncbi:hypothetical protein HDU85_007363 [Gaertneriomyces sp. JEL0708]|nr:hypothetical protein HDU85_007363 [Gaertneriomyces sp. JEL0708]